MAKLEAYLALEETVIDLLQRAWTGHAAQLTAQIVAAAEAERYDEAHALADRIDSGAAFTKLQGRLRELAVSSLILGASNVVPVKQTLWVQGRPLPKVLGPALTQTMRQLNETMPLQVREEAHRAIDAQRRETFVQKAAGELAGDLLVKAADLSLADQLNAAVMGTGKALVTITGNLSTSRLVSYGFLSQAIERSITSYQITEVLDRRACPVCKFMHGQTFQTSEAHVHVERILTLEDPEELKVLAPWPKQDKASLAALFAKSPEDLANDRLYNPPFHPLCRGVLTKSGTVERLTTFEPGPILQVPSAPVAVPGKAAAPVLVPEPVASLVEAASGLQPLDGAAASPALLTPGRALKLLRLWWKRRRRVKL
jgi:hypothetical protein